MTRSPTRGRSTLGAFRRPFVTDPVFWIAAVLSLLIGALVGGGLYVLTGAQTTALGLGVPIVAGVVALWLSFKLLAMGMNTSRALEEAQVADEPRAQALEDKGRAAGAAVGRGAAALVNRGKPKPSTPPPASPAPSSPSAPPSGSAPPSTPPAPASADGDGVTVDKAARVLGSMVGRRLGERRKGTD